MRKKVMLTVVSGTLLFSLVGGVVRVDVTNATGNRCGKACNRDSVTSTDVISIDSNISIPYGASAAASDQDLTVQDMLTYAMQDEYLAQTKYEMIMDAYGVQRPFSNIVVSEGRHIAALENLFNRYGFDIPNADEIPSEYLVTPTSLNDAYVAGVTAEIENIDMYNRFLEQDNLPGNVAKVFTSLRNASMSHLNAFQKHVQ